MGLGCSAAWAGQIGACDEVPSVVGLMGNDAVEKEGVLMTRDDGAPRVQVDSMAVEVAQRMASVLNADVDLRRGDEVPPLWHWAFFADLTHTEDLAPDGHPKRVTPSPEQYPRRLAGGGRVTFLKPLRLGTEATRTSRLAEVRERQGRSGPLILCDLQHEVRQGGEIVLAEVQTVVYRGAEEKGQPEKGGWPSGSARSSLSTKTKEEVELRSDEPVFRRHLAFDLVTLFRFSAATWNSHRIHYDQRYVTELERYPGLLVHGPLLAIHLAASCEVLLGQLGVLKFRSLSPVFESDEVEVRVWEEDRMSCRAEVRRADGTVAMAMAARARI